MFVENGLGSRFSTEAAERGCVYVYVRVCVCVLATL